MTFPTKIVNYYRNYSPASGSPAKLKKADKTPMNADEKAGICGLTIIAVGIAVGKYLLIKIDCFAGDLLKTISKAVIRRIRRG